MSTNLLVSKYTALLNCEKFLQAILLNKFRGGRLEQMLQEKDRAVKRSELLTAFAADVKKFRQQCGHLPAGPPPANETQPQKKLLSSFIAAPTTAAASATLPHWERPQSPAHSQTETLLLTSTMHYAAQQLSNPRYITPRYTLHSGGKSQGGKGCEVK